MTIASHFRNGVWHREGSETAGRRVLFGPPLGAEPGFGRRHISV